MLSSMMFEQCIVSRTVNERDLSRAEDVGYTKTMDYVYKDVYDFLKWFLLHEA